MKKLLVLFCASLVIFCAAVSAAQDKVKPLVGDGTLVVVHVDLAKIDVDKTLNNNRQAIEKMFAELGLPKDKLHNISLDFVLGDLASFSELLEEVLESLRELTIFSTNTNGVITLSRGNETDEIPAEVSEPSDDFDENWKKFVETMIAVKKTLTETCGVQEAFFVFEISESPFMAYLAIPKTDKLNVSQLLKNEKLFWKTTEDNAITRETDDYLFITYSTFGTKNNKKSIIAKLGKIKQTERPDFLEAYEAVKDDAVKIIFAVPSYAKRVIVELKPALPKNWIEDYPSLAAVDIPQFVNGLKFAAIGLNPEQGKIHTVVKTNSEQDANQFTKQADAILTYVSDSFIKELEEEAKELNDIDRLRMDDFGLLMFTLYPEALNKKSLAALKAQLIPKPNGDTISITYDTEKIKTFLQNAGITLTKISQSKSVLAHVTKQQQTCRNRIRQIIVALHVHLDANSKILLPFSVDKNGKRLHSWRVLLLKYLGEEKLYNSIRLDEPWDSEYNKQFHDKMPQAFTCPSCTKGNPKSDTVYCMIVGEKAFGKIDGKAYDLIPDGFSNTIGIVERATPVCWMSPEDVTIEDAAKGINKTPNGIGSEHENGANVGIMDGSTRFLKNDFPLDTLKKLITADAGD